jgi:mono/diheme cytochrome c family protein
MLEQRAQIPVEQRNYGTFYIVFSAILFLGTVWAVWDEVSVRRPWKEYQSQYYDLLYQKLDSLRTEALNTVDSTEVANLQQRLQQAQGALESPEYVEAINQKNDLLKDLDLATRNWRFGRSRSDAAFYQYQQAMLAGRDTVSPRAEVDEYEAAIRKYAAEMEELQTKIARLNETVDKYQGGVSRTEVEIKKLFESADGYNLKLERSKKSPLEIRQVMLPDFEVTPFSEVKARIDRCETCHLGWNEGVMAEAPQPFKTHPLPELLAKHNPETFGCTPCHRGQGPALNEGFAHGNEDHYWETPILRGVETYATCNTCHANETVLKYAKPFTKAKQLILENGCYGCHEIKGYADLPKIGPALNSLPAKTSADWIFRWVRNPRDYNAHTRMPNFRFSDEQAEAITAYLMKIGRESEFSYERGRGPWTGGSASQGKQLFESVGCQACHTVGDDTKVRESRGTGYDSAPELTRIGSKVNPDWVMDWLKNPKHYDPDSRMPSLRLSDGEARNLAAYLMTLKDDRKFPRLALDLENTQKIQNGDKLIREFGCAGCHTIKGMEREGKVSVNLSDFGKKKVEQMDFGNTLPLGHDSENEYQENPDGMVSVQHSWAGWVYGKFKNARLYQTERIVQKMPVYTFNDEEIRLIRTFLMSMTRDVPLTTYQQAFDKRMQDIETGRKLTVRYNCIQCHTLEDRGGSILVKYEDPGLGPPPLPESQGAKVQEQWLHGFLQNPSTVRPWLKLRMPSFQFSDDEIGKIQKYFLGMSKTDFEIRDYSSTPVEAKYLNPGRQLFETYQCAKCHPSGNIDLSELSASDLAPNLALARERLKPEWIAEWVKDPQKLQPGTRMPTFFYEGVAPDGETLGGNVDEQAKALKTYIWTLGKKK